ncbi:MAG: hypothetical protein ABFS12_15625 [Bacteroidota bacterium]
MRISILFILFFGLFSCTTETPPEEENPSEENPFEGILEKSISIGGTLNESIQSIVATDDGGFICAGYSQSDDALDFPATKGENDYLILKFDSDFNQEWSKMYGGTGDDQAKKIIQTSDGGYALCGYTKSDDFDVEENNGQRDFWILKLNAAGAIQWKRSIGFMGDDESFSIIQTQDGGFFTCGYLDVTASGGQGNDDGKKNPNHGVGDIWGVKLDAVGNKVWRRYFGGSNNDRAYDVIETSNSDFIIAGKAESTDYDINDPKGSYDMWIVKVSVQGDLIWEKSFGGTDIDVCYQIINSGDGNYMLVGDTRSTDIDITTNNGYSDIWVIKMSDQGDKIWQKTYGGSSFDSAASIYMTDTNDFVIAGNSRSNDIDLDENKGQNDIWLFKINTSGTLIWQKTFGGTMIDKAYDVIENSDNHLIAVGESSSNDYDINENNGFTDALIIEIK